MYFTSSIAMILDSHFRLMLSVLSCFSLAVVHLTGAAPTTEPSITAEQYPRHRFQRPRIFFPASDSQTASPPSMSNPMMLRSTRLCQRGCTLVASLCYSAFMSIPQGSFAMELLFVHLVRRSGAKQNWRIFSFGVSFKEKKIGT